MFPDKGLWESRVRALGRQRTGLLWICPDPQRGSGPCRNYTVLEGGAGGQLGKTSGQLAEVAGLEMSWGNTEEDSCRGGGLPRLYPSLTPQSGTERPGQTLGAAHVLASVQEKVGCPSQTAWGGRCNPTLQRSTPVVCPVEGSAPISSSFQMCPMSAMVSRSPHCGTLGHGTF